MMRKKLTFEGLVKRCLEVLADEHDFPFYVAFDIPGTKNTAGIYAAKDLPTPGFFRLEIHAGREGSQYTTFHTNPGKSEQELRDDIRKYIADENEISRICAEIKELSDSVDDKEGEFPSDY